MRVTFSHLCDHAFFDEGKKLCIIGVFHILQPPKLPHTHPKMCVAFELAASSDQIGKPQEIGFRITAPSGRVLSTLWTTFIVAVSAASRLVEGEVRATQVINLQNLKFEETGLYVMDLLSEPEHSIQRLTLLVSDQRLATDGGVEHTLSDQAMDVFGQNPLENERQARRTREAKKIAESAIRERYPDASGIVWNDRDLGEETDTVRFTKDGKADRIAFPCEDIDDEDGDSQIRARVRAHSRK
jgi:hypothetical protein